MPDSSLTLGDVIRSFGEALRDQRGALTSAQEAVLSTLARCRTAVLGGHVYRCDACRAEHVAYNGCGNRHCPSCLGHKSAAWLRARVNELLPVPYFHVVFTMPEEVGALALGNKDTVYSILFRAASETLLEVAANPLRLGARIGFLAILHTWTQTLLHHPHLHCVVPGGGLSPDGTRWVAAREGFFLPVRVLSLVYRGKFLAYLEQARQQGLLRGATAQEDARWRAWLRQVRSHSWVVYAKRPFGSSEQVLKYLARYTHRVAISDRRLVTMDAERVTFRYRDRVRGDVTRVMTLSGVEFLRRFLLHVLPRRFVRIRYFGLLTPRYRGLIQQCRALLPTSDAAAAPPAAAADAPAKEPVGERPLAVCPTCGHGRLQWVGELAPTRYSIPPRRPSRYDTS